MRKEQREKISLICYLTASICFYISGMISIMNKTDNWAISLCLGSAFLCLSTTYLYKKDEKRKKKKK